MDFFECHKGKILWVGHILFYKTHMQAGNFNKMDSNNLYVFLLSNNYTKNINFQWDMEFAI
jgi:hypothetical protein